MTARRLDRAECYRCSYDLRGLLAHHCPECGTELTDAGHRRFLAQRRRLDAVLLATLVVTGLGTFPSLGIAYFFPMSEMHGILLECAVSLVAAVASCWFFARVLARGRSPWVGAFGVLPGLATWGVLMFASYVLGVLIGWVPFGPG